MADSKNKFGVPGIVKAIMPRKEAKADIPKAYSELIPADKSETNEFSKAECWALQNALELQENEIRRTIKQSQWNKEARTLFNNLLTATISSLAKMRNITGVHEPAKKINGNVVVMPATEKNFNS